MTMSTEDLVARDGRRSFMAKAAVGAAGAWTVPTILMSSVAGAQASNPTTTIGPADDLQLDHPAGSSPISHVVILMMENRSFDHWLGWLSEDPTYLAAGQSRYGGSFSIDGSLAESYVDPGGVSRTTGHLPVLLAGEDPYRGCGHPDPGHGWNSGRRQRDAGFLATGTGNDRFATGYYLESDLPVSSALARRFTVCDRSHASILGPTYPNRQYLISAQCGTYKSNTIPAGGYPWDTIVERLSAAGVSVRDYFVDVPSLALWGSRMTPFFSPIASYFDQCAAGTLPQVTLIEPGYLTGSRTDNHPHGDVRAGERFLRDVFAAFARSPHWENGLFILTYDEWGGFYDHLAPPILPDDLASAVDADNFGQAGFRVPTIMASPYVRPGWVDHQQYDHTSITRFLEWRFLGAPPVGPGVAGDSWFLRTRDRNANNIGASLVMAADLDIGMDLDVAVDLPSPACAGEGAAVDGAPLGDKHAFEESLDAGYFDEIGFTVQPSPMVRQWVDEGVAR
jgi:phospholipase C